MPRKLSVSVYVNVGGTRYTALRYTPIEAQKGVSLAEVCRAVKSAAVFADRVNTETK